MKIMNVLVLSFVLFLNSMFAESNYFEIDYSRNINKIKSSTGYEKEQSTNGIFLNIGFREDNYTQYLSYSRIHDENHISYESIDYNFDFFISKYTSLTTYVGINIGLGIANENDEYDYNIDYGYKIGMLHDFNDEISLNIGARYTKSETKLSNTYLTNSWSYYIGLTHIFQHMIY